MLLSVCADMKVKRRKVPGEFVFEPIAVAKASVRPRTAKELQQ